MRRSSRCGSGSAKRSASSYLVCFIVRCDTFDKDDITSTLPDGVTDNDESKDDFLGNEVDRGELDVTDEMLANPVSKEQANQALADYRDSLYEADNLAKTGDGVPIIAWVSGATALVALVLLGFYLMRSRKHD